VAVGQTLTVMEVGKEHASNQILMNTVSPYRKAVSRARIFKRLGGPFQGMNSASLCSLAGQYDNPIPTRFLAPIDCLKIPAQIKNIRISKNCLFTASAAVMAPNSKKLFANFYFIFLAYFFG